MNKTYKLSFNFKGERNYVQGPDIFDAVVSIIKDNFAVEQISNIKYAAHNMLYTNADLILTKEFSLAEYLKLNSIITFKFSGDKIFAIVIENKEKVLISHQYSEAIVRQESKIDKDIITFKNYLDNSLSEVIVSMNKFYLQEVVTKEGKWIVTKFEYNSLSDIDNVQGKNLSLQLTNNFNNKLTKSTVRIDGKMVGFIYFSLI